MLYLRLEEGKVVESGNHESLLEINGVYSKLWSVQTGEKSVNLSAIYSPIAREAVAAGLGAFRT